MDVSVASPDGYTPDPYVLDFASSVTDRKFLLTDKPDVAIAGADVVFTDVWASMGQEAEIAARQEAFKGYCVDAALMELTNPGCIIQHCLPAHKGEEITEEVFEAHAKEIFDEAENRLHVHKALIYLLTKGQ
jgi:ornithine carbamoyltransferase